MVFGSLVTGAKALAAAVIGYVVGSMLWGVVSGVVSVVLVSVGGPNPLTSVVFIGPIVGGIFALVAAGKVAGVSS